MHGSSTGMLIEVGKAGDATEREKKGMKTGQCLSLDHKCDVHILVLWV